MAARDLSAALKVIREHHFGSSALSETNLVHAQPWTDRDGRTVGVQLEFEFDERTDLPNLGLPDYEDIGTEEGLPLWTERGLPRLVPTPDSSEAIHDVLSASLYVLLPDRRLYLARGSQDHYYCP